MNIFENDLIRKYFGMDFRPEEMDTLSAQQQMAYGIVQAAQDPIKEGELYLYCSIDYPGEWVVQKQVTTTTEFHPFKLRLPERFQKQECVHYVTCDGCHLPIPIGRKKL